MSNGNGNGAVSELPLQIRETFPEVKGTPLGLVQVADELGFAYLDQDIDFGAVGKSEIFQNVKFIILTEFFSVPLDREFGMNYSMVDRPMRIAEAVLTQEVALKISMYEPRVQFREIRFQEDMLNGKLSPSVVVALLSNEELPRSIPTTGTAAVTVPAPTVATAFDFPQFYEWLLSLGKAPGPAGEEGPPGPHGPPGPPGQIWRGEYDPSTIYSENDAVSFDGSSYICVVETSLGVQPTPDTASYIVPPLANTGSRGSIAQLASSGQTSLWARGDNTWQPLPTISLATSSSDGLLKQLASSGQTNLWCRGDNSWQTLPVYVPPVGAVVQSQYIESRLEVSTTIQLPTAPPYPVTIGIEIFSLSFTPLYATSKLILSLFGFFDSFTTKPSISPYTNLGFFMGSTWLFGGYAQSYNDTNPRPASFRSEVTPGAGAKTYSVRMASSNHPTFTASAYMNGYLFTDFKPVTSFRIEEIKQ